MSKQFDDFIQALKKIPRGNSFGYYQSRKYSVSLKYGPNERSAWLYAEELGGNNHISFNLYFLKTGQIRLKPCEMPEEKVIGFICNFSGIQTN